MMPAGVMAPSGETTVTASPRSTPRFLASSFPTMMAPWGGGVAPSGAWGLYSRRSLRLPPRTFLASSATPASWAGSTPRMTLPATEALLESMTWL